MTWLGLSGLEFALSLLAFGGAVVALYLLREHRRRVEVPALALWQGVLQSKSSATLARRLRRIASLLLALCIVALILLGLADPLLSSPGQGRHVVLLLDTSASMAATDEAPSRLEAARHLARRFVDTLGPADRAVVVAFDQRPRLHGGFSDARAELLETIAEVSQTDAAADLASAVALARDLLRGRSRPALWVFSDGNLRRVKEAEAELAAAEPAIDVRYVRVGKHGRNVAITGFATRRYPLDRSHQECMLRLESFSDVDEPVRLSVRSAGALLYEEELTLAPKSPVTRTLTDIVAPDRLLEAELVAQRGPDALASDDRAFAVLPPQRPLRVTLVSAGNRYLEAALLLDESLEVHEVAPEAYRDDQDADVLVFDHVRPAREPARPALYLGPGDGPGYFPLPVDGSVDRPYFDRVEAEHPSLRKLALADVNIAQAARTRPAPEDRVLASTAARVPLLVEGSRAAPFLALTFDVRRSDLPLRAAYPLFLLRSLTLLSGRDDGFEPARSAGELMRVALPEGASSADLLRPDGQSEPLALRDGEASFWAHRAGVYRLRTDRGELVTSVRTPADESAIAPSDTLLRTPPSAPQGRPESVWGQRPWPALVALALALLALEWITFHRRWTV